MAERERDREGGLLARAGVLARGAACAAAGLPTTLCPPLPVTQLLTRRFGREDRLRRLHHMVGWATFCTERIFDVRLEVSGRDDLPRPSRGHMYISNHQSYADIVVLMGALDTVAFMSKRWPIRYIPVIGRSAYCGGTVYVDRASKESREEALRETLRMCEESTAVVVFPEGTRSEDGELREKIYPRAMHAAHERGLRLVPVAIHGTHRVVPKAMDRVRLGQPVALCIGRPLDPGEHRSGEAYAAACWSAVRSLHEEARARVAAR